MYFLNDLRITKQLILIFILYLGQTTSVSVESGCETGWTAYLDQKCFIALDKSVLGTESEAELACSKQDPSSTLITIHTDQEEQAVAKYLATFAQKSEYAWLGMKWSGKSFAWIDNSQVDYKSWGKDAILDGNLQCAGISLVSYTLGNWTDDNCNKKRLIACQMNQTSLYTLSRRFSELENKVKTLETNTVPIGFIYTQLPNQSSPVDIWPNMKWLDVSKDYAGLFLRTEGGESLPFGQTQPANYSQFLSTSTQSITGVSSTGYSNSEQHFFEKGNWTWIVPGDTLRYMAIFMTTGENRPINTAIRLWKRVE